MILMPLGVGSPTGSNILRAPGAGLVPGQPQPEQTLGRIGLPLATPRVGSPESARMPYGLGARIANIAAGPGGESTVARMMTPRPVTPINASAGTPPPAVMAQQVAPAGPQVKPPAPPAAAAIGGPGIAPTAQVPTATAAPAPVGQAVGAGRPSSPSLSTSAATAPSPWWGQPGGAGGDLGSSGATSPQYWWNAGSTGDLAAGPGDIGGIQKDKGIEVGKGPGPEPGSEQETTPA